MLTGRRIPRPGLFIWRCHQRRRKHQKIPVAISREGRNPRRSLERGVRGMEGLPRRHRTRRSRLSRGQLHCTVRILAPDHLGVPGELSQRVREEGTLLFTGATASWRGNVVTSVFAAGKFAERALSQSLNKEFGRENIHVGVLIVL